MRVGKQKRHRIASLASLLVAAGQNIFIVAYEISFDALRDKRVLVVGGSGRVGGSVVTQLLRHQSYVTVGGTNERTFQEARDRWRRTLLPSHVVDDERISGVAFAQLDRESSDSVAPLLTNIDLVIHTAGPFQGKAAVPNGILKACAELGISYLDVCDDYCTAMAAKTAFASRATAPCIVSTGCWPGVSSLMAKQHVQFTLQEIPELSPADLTVDFSFFTAGSGGAGVTLLVATFLILAEKALIIQNGRRRTVDAMKKYSRINFGSIVGDRGVAPMNLLETASVHDVLGVGSTSAKFGTAPGFWNALLGFMAQLPPSLLENEHIMRKLSIFSMPIVRLVDAFAGATNSMRCDVTCDKLPSVRATAIYGHDNLEPCVGECVVAFACAVLAGAVPAGVWFPEEAISGGKDVAAVLDLASVGAHTKEVRASGLSLLHEAVWGTSKEKLTGVSR